MNYNDYSAERFASDESFIAYCMKSDKQAVLFWDTWIRQHPEKLVEIYTAEEIVFALMLQLPEIEAKEEQQRFEDFLEQHSYRTQESPKVSRLHWLRWSAAACVFMVLLWGAYQFNGPNKEVPVTYVTHQNGNGKISTLTLPDGTLIMLNANSSISYPSAFGEHSREIKLQGEAYFEVAKDKSRPFSVHTGELTTTVLGTHFNVAAYPNLKAIKVALLEGKVKVINTRTKQTRTLKPSQMAVYSPAEDRISLRDFDAKAIVSWHNGTLYFENADFNEIATQLKNRYGITLINDTHETDFRYSGTFNNPDYLTVIKNICFAKSLTFNQKQQTITLSN